MENCQLLTKFNYFNEITNLMDDFLCKQQENRWLSMDAIESKGRGVQNCLLSRFCHVTHMSITDAIKPGAW